MKTDNNNGPIKRDMTIGDVVQNYPSVVDVLQSAGVHCVGCHVAHWETIEQGLNGHGKSEEEINALIVAMNKEVKQDEVVGKDFSVTKKALDEIKKNLEDGQFLRVGVMAGGCSGMSYSLGIETEKKADDHVIELGGINLISDPQSFKLIKGAKLDYLDTFEEKGFRFINPNAKSGCGCGKSFNA